MVQGWRVRRCSSYSPTVDAEGQFAAVIAEMDRVTAERDQYKKLYLEMLELCRKLERGVVGPKREKLSPGDAQVTMPLLAMLLGRGAANVSAPIVEEVRAHTRHKPTGRRPLPEDLPRVDLEVLPLEVQRGGLDAFDRIGEDVTETVEWRRASSVVVRMHKPKFALNGRDRTAETRILQAESPELPIPRSIAGPGSSPRSSSAGGSTTCPSTGWSACSELAEATRSTERLSPSACSSNRKEAPERTSGDVLAPRCLGDRNAVGDELRAACSRSCWRWWRLRRLTQPPHGALRLGRRPAGGCPRPWSARPHRAPPARRRWRRQK